MIKSFCYEDELKKALKHYDSKLDQSYLDKVNQYDLEFTEIFQFNESGLKVKDENIAKMKEVFIHLTLFVEEVTDLKHFASAKW